MKVGIIRCQQTEDLCAGQTCFKVAEKGKGAFADFGPVEVVGFISCGGCPGKRAVSRARIMVESGAKAIAFSTCTDRGSPIGFPCPHFRAMRNAVANEIGDSVQILDYSH